jgi:hypothetical protein
MHLLINAVPATSAGVRRILEVTIFGNVALASLPIRLIIDTQWLLARAMQCMYAYHRMQLNDAAFSKKLVPAPGGHKAKKFQLKSDWSVSQ